MEREAQEFWECAEGQEVSMISVHAKGSSGIWGCAEGHRVSMILIPGEVQGFLGCAEGQGVSMVLMHGKESSGILEMCRKSGGIHDPHP